MSKNDEDHKCSEHQGLAISCSKIDDMHGMIKSIDSKIDDFNEKLDDAIERAFQMDTRISVLETQKTERWRVQKWWNLTFITALIGVGVTLSIEWMKYHGGT